MVSIRNNSPLNMYTRKIARVEGITFPSHATNLRDFSRPRCSISQKYLDYLRERSGNATILLRLRVIFRVVCSFRRTVLPLSRFLSPFVPPSNVFRVSSRTTRGSTKRNKIKWKNYAQAKYLLSKYFLQL